MDVCWKCGREFDDDDALGYCTECGAIRAPQTPTFEKERLKKSDLEHAAQAHIRPTGPADKSLFVELVIREEHIIVPIETRIIFGRDFEISPGVPVVNLERFGAVEAGVSRRHAAFQRTDDNQITLMDLGSTNGTYLNNERIQTLKEYPLADGDAIYFGNLAMVVHIGDG